MTKRNPLCLDSQPAHFTRSFRNAFVIRVAQSEAKGMRATADFCSLILGELPAMVVARLVCQESISLVPDPHHRRKFIFLVTGRTGERYRNSDRWNCSR